MVSEKLVSNIVTCIMLLNKKGRDEVYLVEMHCFIDQGSKKTLFMDKPRGGGP